MNQLHLNSHLWLKHFFVNFSWISSPNKDSNFLDDAPKTDNQRIIYENDEIGVAHSFVTFKDGSRQAVMAVYIISDGKIIHSETGATNIPK